MSDIKEQKLITNIITILLCGICLTRPLICGVTFPKYNLIYQMIIILTLMAWLIISWSQGRLRLVRTGVDRPLFLLSIFIMLSVFSSVNLDRSLKFVWQYGSYIILFYVVANNALSRNKIYLFLGCFSAAAALVSLYGFYQYFWGFEMTREMVKTHPEMVPQAPEFMTRLMCNWIFSTFVYQNALAGYLLINLPIALSLLIVVKNSYLKLTAALSIIFMVAALFMTYSKAGWVICVLVFLIYAVMFVVTRRKEWLQNNRKKIMAVFFVFFTGVTALLIINPADRLDISGFISSLMVRVRYWQAGIAMIKERLWLGFGPDCFGSVYAKFKLVQAEETQMAHNNFLQMWTDSGIFAFIGFIWLWIAFYKRGITKLFQLRKRQAPETGDVLIIGLLAGILGFLLHSLVDFGLYVPGIATQVFFMMGLTIAVGLQPKQDDSSNFITKNVPPSWAVSLMIITAGLTLSACFSQLRLLRAEVYSEIAVAYNQKQEIDKAQALLERTLENNRLDSKTYYSLGALYESKVDNTLKREHKILFEDMDKSLHYYQKAVKYNPYMPYYHYRLSLWFWKYKMLLAGKQEEFKQKALMEMKKAIELYPTKTFYYQQLSRLYTLLGREQEAQEALKKAEELESQR